MGPVVVNAVLQHHQFVLDVVVFVAMGKMPMSRLHEKQRKIIIHQYVEGKLDVLAQYGVKAQS